MFPIAAAFEIVAPYCNSRRFIYSSTNQAGAGCHSGAVVSSRTDSGVHALCNTFHVDIERRRRRRPDSDAPAPFDPATIISGLNAHIRRYGFGADVRIIGAAAVDDPSFHARLSTTFDALLLSSFYAHFLSTGFQPRDGGMCTESFRAHLEFPRNSSGWLVLIGPLGSRGRMSAGQLVGRCLPA